MGCRSRRRSSRCCRRWRWRRRRRRRGFVPWAGGGWQAVRFWGMMGAEVASTVVPAVVAAGSAALVGAQGFEQLQGRAQAVYAVSEALGGVAEQDRRAVLRRRERPADRPERRRGRRVRARRARGSTSLKSGAGGGFLQQGTNTLAMLDRAAAGAVLNVTQGGTGEQARRARSAAAPGTCSSSGRSARTSGRRC